VLLVVIGLILLGLAAGFAFASFKARRIRRVVAQAGYAQGEEPAATFRHRLVWCGVVALAGVVLIVAGSVGPLG
jgi:UPF0716 family protein affecting phage T7 exclusion